MMISGARFRVEAKKDKKGSLLLMKKNKKQILQMRSQPGAASYLWSLLDDLAAKKLDEQQLKLKKDQWLQDRQPFFDLRAAFL